MIKIRKKYFICQEYPARNSRSISESIQTVSESGSPESFQPTLEGGKSTFSKVATMNTASVARRMAVI